LSTLTKFLIILLTIASIFLCGTVVTYVANAQNYKQLWTDLKNEAAAAKENAKDAKDELNKTLAQMDQQKTKLDGQIAALQTQVGNLQAQVNQTDREKSELLSRVDSLADMVKEFYTTTDTQGQMLKNTVDQLEKVRAEQIQQKAELEATSTSLVEKLAIITLLEDKNKTLVQDNAELNDKLAKLLQQFGKAVVAPEPVTPTKAQKALVAPLTKAIGLKGTITAVDLKNSLAALSVGAADGVKEGMKLHVTRGDQFICDILVLDVQPQAAVGSLELTEVTQLRPKTGDSVSTNL
jgi:myosin heavy subunit